MRLVIVANRLPFTFYENNKGIVLKKSPGGLVSAFLSFIENNQNLMFDEYLWVGWPGKVVKKKFQAKIENLVFNNIQTKSVFLSKKSEEKFYLGFCNKTIWPLFHYFTNITVFKNDFWESYKEVNNLFKENLQKVLKPDDIVFIQDFHLMLLPKLLRNENPDLPISFFMHTPFPNFEIFRILPKKWRKEILEGLLGADLIGFHTHDYARYFLQNILRVFGIDNNMGKLNIDNRTVKVETFPIGIDYQKFFSLAERKDTNKKVLNFKKNFAESKLILSLDRLDYTKGIINRLNGFDEFLKNNPGWHKKVSLIVVASPSRIEIDHVQNIKNQIDEMVGKINGEYASADWTPIHYFYKDLSFEEVVTFYKASDVMLVTPIRDGMNLVSKEYLASRNDSSGALILSEMAGSAEELVEAIIVNPNSKEEIAESLKTALEMNTQEQKERNSLMQERLRKYNVSNWINEIMNMLFSLKEEQKTLSSKFVKNGIKEKIITDFKNKQNRLLLFDYDGTLVPFAKLPNLAIPDEQLLKTLADLSKKQSTTLVLISGRDKQILNSWFKTQNISLVAEHGAYVKEKNDDWKLLKPLNSEWKKSIYPILKRYVNRLSGSLIEEKEFSLVWHYRKANLEIGKKMANDLMNELVDLIANQDLQVIPGNKIVEIRNSGINKGLASLHFLNHQNYDFILSIGDDSTDEDMFKALPKNAYTIKVGPGKTDAKYNIKSQNEVNVLIEELAKN